MISEKKFLGYGWPPKMPSYQFKKENKKYQHEVVFIGSNDPETGFVLHFPSEKKARNAVKSMKESTNILEVGYEKQEIKPEDEGFHTVIKEK